MLVGLNILGYLTEWVYPRVVNYFDMIGAAYDPTINQTVGVAHDQWYRLLTSAFLHEPGLSGFGPAHIIFNMWALIMVGPALEQMLGRLRFLAVYLLSALGGSVLYYLYAAPNQSALGASGAIFGLFGAWFVLARRLRLDSRAIVFLIVLNLAISFAVPSIAWQDHVGGLVTGAVLTAAYAYAPRNHRALVQLGRHPDRGGGAGHRRDHPRQPARCGRLPLALLARGDDPRNPPRSLTRREHGSAAPRLVSQCPGGRPPELAQQSLANYRHLVDSTTPTMMNANPTTRFQSARAPIGRLPWVT